MKKRKVLNRIILGLVAFVSLGLAFVFAGYLFLQASSPSEVKSSGLGAIAFSLIAMWLFSYLTSSSNRNQKKEPLSDQVSKDDQKIDDELGTHLAKTRQRQSVRSKFPK
jgi:hypothetical protein